jgi:hypothetical protein
MGFGNATEVSTKVTYVKFTSELGKFYVKSKEGADNSVPHIIKMGANTGQTEYRVYASAFEGKLIDVFGKANDYGYYYVFKFQSLDGDDEIYQLDLKASDSNARNLALKLASCEIGQEVRVYSWLQKDDVAKVDRARIGVCFKGVSKENSNIPYFFTIEQMPKAIESVDKRTGKKTYDFTPVLDFFDEKVLTIFLEKKSKNGGVVTSEAKSNGFGSAQAVHEDTTEEEGDLPF